MYAQAVPDEAGRGARGTVVYLVPGLSVPQRRAALRRLRQEGSRNCGPPLPSAELTVALAADRVRVGLRHTTAAVRRHPASALVSMALAGALLTALAFASAARATSSPSPCQRAVGPCTARAPVPRDLAR
jgi:hypothetical protein